MFEMKIDEDKKAFIICVGGYFRQDEGQAFLETYYKNVSSLKPANYNIVILGEELITSGPEMVKVLEQAVNIYKETGFKKYYGTLPRSPLAAMQLKRIIIKSGLDITFADNVDDIMNVI